MILHVAVVDRLSSDYQSGRPDGDFAAFISDDRQEAIQRALRARNRWGRDKYRVLLGTLDSEVSEPVQYTIGPLGSQP